MSDRRTIILRDRAQLDLLGDILRAEWRSRAEAGNPLVVTVDEECRRTAEQNALLWPLLQQWAIQKPWQVNGQAQHLTKEDWKVILTASFRGEAARIAPGLDGGMVLLGISTRAMGKREFSRFLDWLFAAAHHHGVNLPPPIDPHEPIGRTA
jgi:hypothetical protein